nr:MAG TPA: hypothetical protein [Caudoviricetes sp.]
MTTSASLTQNQWHIFLTFGMSWCITRAHEDNPPKPQ